jgi:hypothetical protein
MPVDSGLGGRTRQELALLVPEYLLAGHLIDRAGMPHLIGAFGRNCRGARGTSRLTLIEIRGRS